MGNKSRNTVGVLVTILFVIRLEIWAASEYTDHQIGSLIDDGTKMLAKGDAASLQVAIQDFKKAMKTASGNSSQEVNEGIAEFDLGLAYEAAGQNSDAIQAFQDAIPILQKNDKNDVATKAQSHLAGVQADDAFKQGMTAFKAKHWTDAATAFRKAAPLYQQAGDTEDFKHASNNLGSACFNQALAAANKNDDKGAVTLFQQAQAAFHQAEKPSDEADCFKDLAIVYTDMGEADKAAQATQQEQALRSSTHSGS